MIDLYSRRLLACPISEHPDSGLCMDAIKIAAAVRGGRQAVDGVIFTATAARPADSIGGRNTS